MKFRLYITLIFLQSIVCCDNNVQLSVDINAPFTVTYADSSVKVCARTAVFAHHLRDYVNSLHLTGHLYYDSCSGLQVFNVFMLKNDSLIKLERAFGSNDRSSWHLLNDYLSCISEKVSIWNICKEVISLDSTKTQSYKNVIWYAVLGSSNVVEMRNLLMTQQIKQALEKHTSFE